MAGRVLPGLGLTAYYNPGENGWDATFNPDMRKLSVLVMPVVFSRVDSLPDTPSPGDIHILTAEDSNSGPSGSIILWEGPAGSEEWVYITPSEGWEVWSIADAAKYRYVGGAWLQITGAGGSADAADVTYNSGDEGDSNSEETTVQGALDDLYSRVRDGAPSAAYQMFASQYNAGASAASAQLAAFVGARVLVRQNISVGAIGAEFNSTVDTGQYQAHIVELDGSNEVTAVMGSSAVLVNSGTARKQMLFNFATPVALVAGNTYGLLVGRPDIADTTAVDVSTQSTSGAWQGGFPVEHHGGFLICPDNAAAVGTACTATTSAFRYNLSVYFGF